MHWRTHNRRIFIFSPGRIKNSLSATKLTWQFRASYIFLQHPHATLQYPIRSFLDIRTWTQCGKLCSALLHLEKWSDQYFGVSSLWDKALIIRFAIPHRLSAIFNIWSLAYLQEPLRDLFWCSWQNADRLSHHFTDRVIGARDNVAHPQARQPP